MSGLMNTLKQAFQGLKKKAGFVSAILLTMGVTLGSLFCVVTLSYFLFIKPLPYPDQDRIFSASYVQYDEKKELKGSNLSYEALLGLYKDKDAFETSTLISYAWDLITSKPSQPRVNTLFTSPEYFEIFDVPMAKGRGFLNSEAVEKKNPAAVISYDAWEKHFALNQNILSQKINLGGVSYQIIGVISKDFIEPELYQIGLKSEIWLTWNVNGAFDRELNWSNKLPRIKSIGKLKPEISKTQAEQKLSANLGKLWLDGNVDNPDRKKWVNHVELTSVKDKILGKSEIITIILLLGVIGLLLIAITNVANLFISRASEQVRQLAIRSVLGAKKKNLFNLVFAEIILLMFFSGLIALVIASFGLTMMTSYLSGVFPQVDSMSINTFTYIFSFLVIVILAFVFSKVSTGVINYKNLNSVIQSSGKGTGVQVSSKTRKILIILQVTIATFLVFSNLLLFNQALKPLSVSKGYDLKGVYMLYLPPNSVNFPSASERIGFTQAIKKKLLSYSQISLVSHSQAPLMVSGNGLSEYVSVTSDKKISSNMKWVDHNYFALMGMNIIKGEGITARDIHNFNQLQINKEAKNFNKVTVVNENFARKLDSNMNVIGKFIRKGESDPYKIVGVISDSILPPAEESQATVFVPSTESGFTFIIKYNSNDILSREQIVSIVQAESSLYSPYIYKSIEGEYKQKLFREKLTTVTTAVLSLLVLFLAVVGLYGIFGFSINSRRLELGTRMAIGAKRKDMIFMIFKDNLPSIIWGFIGSIILIVVLFVLYKSKILAYINMTTVFVMGITVVILLLLITFFSCYWPLRKFINAPVIKSLKG